MKPRLLANENVPEEPGQLLAELLAEPSRFAGQFVVVEEGSIRIRPLPDA